MSILTLPRTLLLATLTLLAGCAPNQSPADTGKGSAGNRGKTNEPRSCTEMACFDEATITTSIASAEAPLGSHAFELEIDGLPQTCTVEFAVATETAQASCSGGASLRFGPAMRGVEHQMDGVVGYSEEPIPGQFQWALSIESTPQAAHVIHRHADAVVLDQTATFEYADHRPNGDGCEPVCQTASVTWTSP